MKKIFILLLVLILPITLMCGCSDNEDTNINGNRFIEVSYQKDGRITIYVDKETNVMYMFVKHGYGGGLTVMLNADGTPMLWEGNA